MPISPTVEYLERTLVKLNTSGQLCVYMILEYQPHGYSSRLPVFKAKQTVRILVVSEDVSQYNILSYGGIRLRQHEFDFRPKVGGLPHGNYQNASVMIGLHIF